MKYNIKKKFNYGISLLRVLLCLMVVFDHLYDYKKKRKYIYILYYHIPCFFLLSFYFTYNTFFACNISRIKSRFQRLLIPYFCWSLVYWTLFNIYHYILNKKCPHSFFSFLDNIFCGRIFYPHLWFQNILIFNSLLLSIIIMLFREQHLLILLYLSIFFYIFQYTNINYYFFTKYYKEDYYFTYGRIAECFPHSITGYFLYHFNANDMIKNNKKNAFFLNLIIIIFISKYKFDSNLLSFKYGGLRKNIASICLFIIFSVIQIERFDYKKLNKYLKFFTSYTAGIYFLHVAIGRGELIKLILNKNIIYIL